MMRETFTYKVYLNYYRLKTRVKRVFDLITTIIGYTILVIITIAMKIIHFFLIGCFIGSGVAFGFWLVKH